MVDVSTLLISMVTGLFAGIGTTVGTYLANKHLVENMKKLEKAAVEAIRAPLFQAERNAEPLYPKGYSQRRIRNTRSKFPYHVTRPEKRGHPRKVIEHTR